MKDQAADLTWAKVVTLIATVIVVVVGTQVFLWQVFDARLAAHEMYVQGHLQIRDRDIQRQLDEIKSELRSLRSQPR